MDLKEIVADFTHRLSNLIEAETVERAREAVAAALPETTNRGRRSAVRPLLIARGKKPRRKGLIQLCPVPGCKDRAAPVFGMVCAKHKGIAKSKIKKYREARRTAKLKKAA